MFDVVSISLFFAFVKGFWDIFYKFSIIYGFIVFFIFGFQVSTVFREIPKVIIPDNGLNYYMNGGRLALNRCEADNFDSETYTAFDKSGKFLGLAGIANGEFFGKWKIQ